MTTVTLGLPKNHPLRRATVKVAARYDYTLEEPIPGVLHITVPDADTAYNLGVEAARLVVRRRRRSGRT